MLAALALPAVPAAALEDMVALTDEPSRGELFERNLKPDDTRALTKTFAFPLDAEFEAPGKPRKNSIFGIDISHHNESRCKCKIDWTTMRAQNVAFVYLKASQGARFFDPTFKRNWERIAALPPEFRLYRGAYHFLSADVDAVQQAQHFLRVVPKLQPADMAPCLDLEWDMRKGPDGKTFDAWSKVAPIDIADRALAWLREVRDRTGKTPVIYTNRFWWNERIGEDRMALFKDFPIWIADYSASRLATEKPIAPKRRDWLLWQFSENATVLINGAPSQVDANVFKGPMSGLKRGLGIAD
jgi:lysozyme